MYKELLAQIKKYETIIIHRHQKPDGDALGSQFGLREIIKTKFPEKKVLIVGEKEELEKSSLKNIFNEDFDKVKNENYKGSLVIIVDTANVERIKGEDFFRGDFVFKIDHHKTAEHFGDIEWVEDEISSNCEIIAGFARKNKLEVTKKAAQYLLAGIITDTGRFMYNSVKEGAFEEAFHLVKAGAKPHKIVNALNDRNLNFTRLQGKIQTDLTFEKGVVSYMMPKGLHKKYKVDYSTASSLVFILMSFSEANYALYSTYDSTNKVWRSSLRSRKKPINKIAEEHRGGGHEMAAGLKIADKKEFQVVLNKLKKLNNE